MKWLKERQLLVQTADWTGKSIKQKQTEICSVAKPVFTSPFKNVFYAQSLVWIGTYVPRSCMNKRY
jgi:hypothetical protein